MLSGILICLSLATVFIVCYQIESAKSLPTKERNAAGWFSRSNDGIIVAERDNYQKEKFMCRRDPIEDMTTPQIIKYCGYPAEIHHVTTDDGYILEMHRIPNFRKNVQKTPVFVQHGLLGSSADWVLNPCNKCLPMMLSDEGYDVWLGNIRGNRYSRNNTKFSPKDKQFWRFSFDEMAKYDLPAMLNYTLNKTGAPNLKYVGFSMGTTMMFSYLALHPEHNNKIENFYALAPAVEMGHVTSPVIDIAPWVNCLEFITKFIGLEEFLPNSRFMKFLGDTVCRIAPREFCENVMFVIAGYDPWQMNSTRVPIIIKHSPAGASVQTLVHFAQLYNAKRFQHFDWGAKANLAKYGQASPPIYNVSAIKTPVWIFWGSNDILADPEDVGILKSMLPNVKAFYNVPIKTFNHIDFTWAIDAPEAVYKPLIKMMAISKNKPLKYYS